MNSNSNGAALELDLPTLRILDALAKRWGVSREAAIQRAIVQASPESAGSNSKPKIEALKELQKNLRLTPETAAAWEASVRDARR